MSCTDCFQFEIAYLYKIVLDLRQFGPLSSSNSIHVPSGSVVEIIRKENQKQLPEHRSGAKTNGDEPIDERDWGVVGCLEQYAAELDEHYVQYGFDTEDDEEKRVVEDTGELLSKFGSTKLIQKMILCKNLSKIESKLILK